VAPPEGVGGTMSPSLLRHVPCRGYNKIQIGLHILTSLGLHVHKTLCFKLFSTEIDGIRTGYYQTRNALKPTYSHIRSQNFWGRNPLTPDSSSVSEFPTHSLTKTLLKCGHGHGGKVLFLSCAFVFYMIL